MIIFLREDRIYCSVSLALDLREQACLTREKCSSAIVINVWSPTPTHIAPLLLKCHLSECIHHLGMVFSRYLFRNSDLGCELALEDFTLDYRKKNPLPCLDNHSLCTGTLDRPVKDQTHPYYVCLFRHALLFLVSHRHAPLVNQCECLAMCSLMHLVWQFTLWLRSTARFHTFGSYDEM